MDESDEEEQRKTGRVVHGTGELVISSSHADDMNSVATTSELEPASHTEEGAQGASLSASGAGTGSESPVIELSDEVFLTAMKDLERTKAQKDNKRTMHNGKLVYHNEHGMDHSFTSNAEDLKEELGDTTTTMDESFTSNAEEPHGQMNVDHSSASIVLARLTVGHTNNTIDAMFGWAFEA